MGKYIIPNTVQTCKIIFIAIYVKILIVSNTLAKIDKAPPKTQHNRRFQIVSF